MVKFNKKENSIIANTSAKKGLILKLLNDQARYIRRKIGHIYRKLVKKNPDNNKRKQKNKSKQIDKLRFRNENSVKSENSNTNKNTIDNNTIDNNTNDINEIRGEIRVLG